VFAKGYNLNRSLEGCEVIFCPIVDNWEKYLVINQTDSNKNIEAIEKAELLSEEKNFYFDVKRRG
jgi:hypothetical protein